MADLTNEEIRKGLLELNYDCGPVTDTTRDILLKKLKSLSEKLSTVKKQNVVMTDEELRSELTSYGVSVAPITSTNRNIYLKRLEALKKSSSHSSQKSRKIEEEFEEWEPMEID